MLNTLPARPTAASYSAFSSPVASSTSIRRRCGIARSSHAPSGPWGTGRSPTVREPLPVEVDVEGDEPAGRDAAEQVFTRLARADEHDEELLVPRGRERA